MFHTSCRIGTMELVHDAHRLNFFGAGLDDITGGQCAEEQSTKSPSARHELLPVKRDADCQKGPLMVTSKVPFHTPTNASSDCLAESMHPVDDAKNDTVTRKGTTDINGELCKSESASHDDVLPASSCDSDGSDAAANVLED